MSKKFASVKSEILGAGENSGFRAPDSLDGTEDDVAPDCDETEAIVNEPKHSAEGQPRTERLDRARLIPEEVEARRTRGEQVAGSRAESLIP